MCVLYTMCVCVCIRCAGGSGEGSTFPHGEPVVQQQMHKGVGFQCCVNLSSDKGNRTMLKGRSSNREEREGGTVKDK